MGVKPSKESTQLINDINFCLIRTHINTPRRRAILEFESTNGSYVITIKDKGLRTLEKNICDYKTAKSHIKKWVDNYQYYCISHGSIVGCHSE